MTPDELFMKRALQLARLGMGSVSPNPMVGCVIVRDGNIIGEGWHKKYGAAHAEINAINSIIDKSEIKGSTIYVNLEPCSHFGKTPPCADALMEQEVGRVVIANLDSNPLVAGSGIKKLREAGIEVTIGVLKKEGRELNKRFFTFHEQLRPYVILKWAQTADGFMARANYESRWISNEYSRQLVHKWRTEEDAVLVGTKTAAHDNPLLTTRDWTGHVPVRIVLDRFLRLSDRLHVFDRSTSTICYNVLKHEEHENLKLVRLNEQHFFQEILKDLQAEKILSVMVEGGAQTLSLFINSGQWDEMRVFTSRRSFQDGIKAPVVRGFLRCRENIGTDQLEIFYREPEIKTG
jgi:diaminohydroxyphosphoribosylaminopyrimidine deaminase / 5-amino-6-(5-phosphoribosylamino)uracil reductase